MEKKELRVFEYAIVLQPKWDKDGEKVEDGELLDNGMILAGDHEQATLIAGRRIPDAQMEQLERVTLAVRPF